MSLSMGGKYPVPRSEPVINPKMASVASSDSTTRCNLNADCPGGECWSDDPKPDLFQPPFELGGCGPTADVVVTCP